MREYQITGITHDSERVLIEYWVGTEKQLDERLDYYMDSYSMRIYDFFIAIPVYANA